MSGKCFPSGRQMGWIVSVKVTAEVVLIKAKSYRAMLYSGWTRADSALYSLTPYSRNGITCWLIANGFLYL